MRSDAESSGSATRRVHEPSGQPKGRWRLGSAQGAPREHQARFARFHSAGIDGLNDAGIDAGYAEHVVMRDLLSQWLDDVADGKAPKNATTRLADGVGDLVAHHEYASNVLKGLRLAWTGVGARWELLLEGMALGHTGAVVAVFHDYAIGWQGWHAQPHARIETGDLDWVVGVVPTAIRPLLAEREHGLAGLILADDYIVGHFDADRCGLLLRNLLSLLGVPELATLVRVHDSADDDAIERRAEPAVHLERRQTGFSTGTTGLGTSREFCLPAVRAAAENQSLNRTQRPGPAPSARRARS